MFVFRLILRCFSRVSPRGQDAGIGHDSAVAHFVFGSLVIVVAGVICHVFWVFCFCLRLLVVVLRLSVFVIVLCRLFVCAILIFDYSCLPFYFLNVATFITLCN